MSIVQLPPRLARSGALVVAMSAALLAVPVIFAVSPALAADPPSLPSECVQGANVGDPVVCTYTTAGEHSFTVPSGVTSLSVDLIGGKGGDGTGTIPTTTVGHGGEGAEVSGTVTGLTAGTTIFAEVGGNGNSAGKGGFNGGGNTGTTTATGAGLAGGGGGASDIRTNSTDLSTRLVVAGGGGGAGATVDGGGAGQDGEGAAGPSDTKTNGKAASGTTGGAKGSPTNGSPPGNPPTAGTAGIGGNGRATTGNDGYIGGGGGGGLAGGGGGDEDVTLSNGIGGGGGGGSSLVPGGGTGPTLTSSAAKVQITYTPAAAAFLSFTMTSPIEINTADAIGDIKEFDSLGATIAPSALVFTTDPSGAGTCDASSCTFTQTGDVVVTGTDGAATSQITVTVTHTAKTLVIAPASATAFPSVGVPFTTTATDSAGATFDATADSTFTIAPSNGGSADGASCTKNVCKAKTPGEYSVSAQDGSASAIGSLVVVAPPTSTAPTTPTPTTPTASTSTPAAGGGGKGPLASTGSQVENDIKYALALLAVGAVIVSVARSRRRFAPARVNVQRPRTTPTINFGLPPHKH